MPELKQSLTATGVVSPTKGRYWGYVVTTTLSAAAVTIYDNTSAAGTIIDVIPASTAAGTTKNLASGINCTNGIYASFAGTGTVTFLYD